MGIKDNNATTVRDIEQEEKEPVIVDINDTSLADGEQQEIDAKEDWQAQAAPPPAARYRVKIFTSNKTEIFHFEQGRKFGYEPTDNKGVYYIKNLTCKIQDEGGQWHNTPIDYKVSTGIQRGKKVSSMVGLMLMGGVQIKSASMSDKQVASMFAKWLAKEPILVVECDWQAWDSSDKAKLNPKTPFGVLLLKGMKNFPMKPDGKTRNHVVKNASGQEFVAKLKIVKWVGKSAAATPVPATSSVSAAPTGIQPVKATLAPASKPKAAPVPPPVVEEEIQIGEETTEGEFSFDDDGEVVLEG